MVYKQCFKSLMYDEVVYEVYVAIEDKTKIQIFELNMVKEELEFKEKSKNLIYEEEDSRKIDFLEEAIKFIEDYEKRDFGIFLEKSGYTLIEGE